MNKEQKEQEQKLRILKFDCEMRLKSVEIASNIKTSNNVEKLLFNAEHIARYVFGIRKKIEEDPIKSSEKEVIIENKKDIIK